MRVVLFEDNTQRLPKRTSANQRKVIYAHFGSKSHKLSTKISPRILLLQGPVGPFYKHLQLMLGSNDYDTWQMCFTAGDRVFSNRTKRIPFSEGLDQWSSWFDQFLTYSQVDCIVLFGCERPIHRIAIDLAKTRGVPVISLEEGYIRPGYVTIERGGNNRLSPLAGLMPPDDFECTQPKQIPNDMLNSFTRMCWYGLIYYLFNIASSLRQRETFHKNRSLGKEAYFWSRNLARKIINQGQNFKTIEKLLEHHEKKYFVIPLQVSDDTQLQNAAKGWTNDKLISATISSFTRYVSKNVRLVFKIHPLERGHSNNKKLIKLLSNLHNVTDRVDVIETGSLGLLVKHSIGMITINSTSGLSAIAHAVPLLVMGEAIYTNTIFAKSAIDKNDLDEFWNNNVFSDRVKSGRYLSWLRENSLKAGDFYSREGIEIASKGVMVAIESVLRDKVKKIDTNANRKMDNIELKGTIVKVALDRSTRARV